MRFSIYQESKRGGRKTNQDRIGYVYTKDSLLMVLCDGMGGHMYGEVAAQLAVQAIGKMFQREARSRLSDPRQFLEDAMMAAHVEIHRYRAGRGLPESPRTTCVTAVFQNDTAWWAHAGDSRLYWIRDSGILEVTRDHSQLEAMIADGLLNKNDTADDLPDRNSLFNCLGAPAMPLIELADPVKIRVGDCFLLCSDGLWAPLNESTIATVFKDGKVMRAVPDLVNLALAEAGATSDNVSAIGMSWDDPGNAQAESTLTAPTVLGEDEFVTTIPVEADADADADPMSEDAIESAIAEIRQAIARTQKTGGKNK
ncbi:MAG: PP2C family protein-serine/threonine phosphatase [Burkholderiales bacterium]